MKLKDFIVTDEKTSVALGNFDGVHLGHRRVISSAVRTYIPAYVMAVNSKFSVLQPELAEQAVEQLGAKLIQCPFEEICDMDGETFVSEVLVKKLNCGVAVCGSDFRFGKGARWDASDLKTICARQEIAVLICPMVEDGGVKISSSILRNCMKEGDMEAFRRLTGRAFSFRASVVGGDRRGRTLGFPTANQRLPVCLAPVKYGVYASRVQIEGKIYDGMTNIGIRPTFSLEKPQSETYIFDFSGDLYGQELTVSLVKYLRGETRFSSAEELKNQMERDAVRARAAVRRPPVRAVFFDFDDTLQDRAKAYETYCNLFIDTFFGDKPLKTRAEMIADMERLVNGGYIDRKIYFSKLIDHWGWKNHPEIDTLIADYHNRFGYYTALFPQAVQVIETLRARGIKTGIITNGPSKLQNTKLSSSGLRDLMDVIIVSGDLGIHKPDRAIFDCAAQRAGVENASCLYVGDHPVNDIQGALGAGMQALRLNFGTFYNVGLGGVPEIKSIEEVLNYI